MLLRHVHVAVGQCQLEKLKRAVQILRHTVFFSFLVLVSGQLGVCSCALRIFFFALASTASALSWFFSLFSLASSAACSVSFSSALRVTAVSA